MTLTIAWEPSFSVHNNEIDAEHQKLLLLANKIFAIEQPNSQADQFRAAVKELFRYMAYHFRHEEELMQRVRYPQRELHHAKHEAIVAAMNSLMLTCTSLDELCGQLHCFLGEWVLRHIAEEDSQMAASVDRYAVATRDRLAAGSC